MKNTFVEICIYEVKPNKTEEFESLVQKVVKHHKNFPGVIDVKYMKRTHRQESFQAAKAGKLPVKLTRAPKAITYVMYWELKDEIAHAKATKSGLQHFFKEFSCCLTTIPKIILGKRIR